MKLTGLEISRVRIPFRTRFVHASAKREETESVWVEARSVAGVVGYGESCPRRYVTGEDTESARGFFARHRDSLLREVDNLESLRRWTGGRKDEIDRAPAAWCAVELALLDLFAREETRSVEAFLGLREPRGAFRYSAVIGDGDLASFYRQLERYVAYGFRDFKLKLGGNAALDRAKLACLKQEDDSLRVRVDANNLWRDAREALAYLRALDASLFAVEEPLPPGRIDCLSALAEAADTTIVLDESLLRAEQVAELPGDPARWIINVRVSKMGGLLRSLAVVEAARRRGIQIVVGAHVGETSLLTRAALGVAAHAPDLRIAQEGAFGTWLLQNDVCDPPLMFGRGGLLTLRDPSAPGWGIDVSIEPGSLENSGRL